MLADSAMSKPKKPDRQKHLTSYESLIAWGCICGARWLNEKLKGKSDGVLAAERDNAFYDHVKKMQAEGF